MPIVFNETITADNRVEMADRHVRETLDLLDGGGWDAKPTLLGVKAATRMVDVRDAARSRTPSPVLGVRASIELSASRATVFSLVSKPERAPEWDVTDRGFEWVDVFDPSHTVFRNFNAPFIRKIDSVLYRIALADQAPDRSLYCARSVISAKGPVGQYKRLYQQIFAWSVRDRPKGCELVVMATTPENFAPMALQRLGFVGGWRKILRRIHRICG